MQRSCMIRWKQIINRVTSWANLFKKFIIWIYNEYIRCIYRNQWPSWLATITVASNSSASAALSWISTGSLTMEHGCKRDLAIWDRDFWFKSEMRQRPKPSQIFSRPRREHGFQVRDRDVQDWDIFRDLPYLLTCKSLYWTNETKTHKIHKYKHKLI